MAGANKQNHEPITRVRQHIQSLGELAAIASAKIPAESLLSSAVTLVSNAIEIDHVKILRYRPVPGDLLLEAGVGWRPGVVGSATFPVDFSSAPGRTFQTGQPTIIPNFGATKEFRPAPILVEHGIVSLVNVPIQINGAAWGVLEADSVVARDFSIDTLAFLVAAASILASAIHREQLDQAHARAVAAAAEEGRRSQILLQEMQHRVKNNFQTILAMIAIQKRREPSEAGQAVLSKTADAIMAMSLAHNQLAASQRAETVHLPSYISALATSMQQPLEKVTIDVLADEISTGIEKAMPLGLIINELVTNSVKHAYGPAGGAVKIVLANGPGKGEARLTVSDEGRGMGAAGSGGAGLKLIEALVQQIYGRLTVDSSSKGTTVTIAFGLSA